jgi:hypothetical protein
VNLGFITKNKKEAKTRFKWKWKDVLQQDYNPHSQSNHHMGGVENDKHQRIQKDVGSKEHKNTIQWWIKVEKEGLWQHNITIIKRWKRFRKTWKHKMTIIKSQSKGFIKTWKHNDN